MKKFFLFFFALIHYTGFSQNIQAYEKSPTFPDCESQPIDQLKACFNNKINTYIFENFKVPQIVADDSYKGDIKVLFEVNDKGDIKVLYVDAVYDELKEEKELLNKQL